MIVCVIARWLRYQSIYLLTHIPVRWFQVQKYNFKAKEKYPTCVNLLRKCALLMYQMSYDLMCEGAGNKIRYVRDLCFNYKSTECAWSKFGNLSDLWWWWPPSIQHSAVSLSTKAISLISPHLQDLHILEMHFSFGNSLNNLVYSEINWYQCLQTMSYDRLRNKA